MSDTPRTDAFFFERTHEPSVHAWRRFAKTLERELAEARAEIERLQKYEDEWARMSQDEGKAEREIERLRVDIEKLRSCRDELREATEAMDDPRINNIISLADAIKALREVRRRRRASRHQNGIHTLVPDGHSDLSAPTPSKP